MKLKCKCGNIMDLGAEHAGGTIACPRCGKVCRIPRSAGAPSPPGDEQQSWAEEEFELAGPEAPGPGDRRPRRRTRPPRDGSVDEAGPEGFDEEGLELAGPEAPSPKAGAGREEAAAPEGAALAGFGDEDFELVEPQLKGAEEEAAAVPLAAGPAAPGAAPRVVEVEVAVEQEEGAQADNVFSLFWMCLRGPFFIGEIDQAIARRKMLFLQIVVLFALLLTIPALLETRGPVVRQYDSRLIAFESKFLHKLLEFAIALPVLYFFLVVTGSGIPFFRLAGVLLFIRVMASVLVAGLAAIGVVSWGLHKVGLGLAGGWDLVLGLSFWVYIGVAVFYQIKFLQSRSDISGFGGFMMHVPILVAYWYTGRMYMPKIMQMLGLWGGLGSGAAPVVGP